MIFGGSCSGEFFITKVITGASLSTPCKKFSCSVRFKQASMRMLNASNGCEIKNIL